MSTPNFHNGNASRIFAFGMNKYVTQEDIEANGWEDLDINVGDFDEDLTNMDYQDTICNVRHELKSKGYDTKLDQFYSESFEDEIGHKTFSFEYCGLQLSVTIGAQVYSGYYEGATLDWDAKAFIEGRWNDKTSEYGGDFECDLTSSCALCEDDILYANPFANMGLSKIHAKRIIKKIYDKLEEVAAELEEVFKRFCEHELVCGGIFSSGEAIYYEADSLKGKLATV